MAALFVKYNDEILLAHYFLPHLAKLLYSRRCISSLTIHSHIILACVCIKILNVSCNVMKQNNYKILRYRWHERYCKKDQRRLENVDIEVNLYAEKLSIITC